VNTERNAIDKHVGTRVRMRRLMLDLTQMQLADGLGLTFQQVQKYEKGTNRISASRLHQLSRILRVPVPLPPGPAKPVTRVSLRTQCTIMIAI
jgi:transcriptional regulator with XRE-family HTH domain